MAHACWWRSSLSTPSLCSQLNSHLPQGFAYLVVAEAGTLAEGDDLLLGHRLALTPEAEMDRVAQIVGAHRRVVTQSAVPMLVGECHVEGLGRLGERPAGHVAAVADDRLFALWRVYATTGMRRGEGLGLQWRHVDLDKGRLTVQQARVTVGYKVILRTSKTGPGRMLPVGGRA